MSMGGPVGPLVGNGVVLGVVTSKVGPPRLPACVGLALPGSATEPVGPHANCFRPLLPHGVIGGALGSAIAQGRGTGIRSVPPQHVHVAPGVNLAPWGFGVARPLNELQGVLA